MTIEDLGLEIHFVKENVILAPDSRSSEKFMHGIKVLMAKNYIDNLSEETKKGMREKAEQGTWPSWAPMGYMNVEVDKKKKIVPDPDAAPIVRRMFEWYAAGDCSLEEVRRRAVEAGLIGRRGKAPAKSKIEYALRNVFYTGLFVWNGQVYQGDHEPLVSQDLFRRAQEAFRKDNKPKANDRLSFAYTGLMTCAHCGCAITAEKKKGRYVYYHCTGSRRGCAKPAVREEALESLLGDVVRAVVVGQEVVDWVKAALRESHEEERTFHDGQIEVLQREYVRVQRLIDNAYEDKLEGRISEDLWQRKQREWGAALTDIRGRVENHENASRAYYDEGGRILDLASRAYDLWLQQNAVEKSKLLRVLLSNCTFDGTSLSPTYRKPFCWLVEGQECTNWLRGRGSNPQPSG